MRASESAGLGTARARSVIPPRGGMRASTMIRCDLEMGARDAADSVRDGRREALQCLLQEGREIHFGIAFNIDQLTLGEDGGVFITLGENADGNDEIACAKDESSNGLLSHTRVL